MPERHPPSVHVRAESARCVAAVFAGHSLDDALAEARASLPAGTHPLLQQITYGVLRDWQLLNALINRLTRRPPKPPLLAALLAVGLYQLRSLRTADHAVVDNSVSASTILGLHRARGMVNAVLRRYQRERDTLEAALPTTPAVQCSHPQWMIEQMRKDWPDDWQALLHANQEQPPMWLRVNTTRISVPDYQRQLVDADLAADTSSHAPTALRLEQAVPVQRLPGFADGLASVQDAAAQLAAPLLDAGPGQRVLDACAAPGGKSAHLLEACPDLHLTALDIDARRMQRVADNLQRLGLVAALRTGDAADPQGWWDGKPYDRILLDAPCSGSGVIRRHPDIKWLRREQDIDAFAKRQTRLLAALWPLLAPTGLLVYATCSVFSAEGDQVIHAHLATHSDAGHLPIDADWGAATQYGRRVPTGAHGMDGFYFARLARLAPSQQVSVE